MLKQITDKTQVEDILKSHFKTYQITDDPFEKVIVYTKKDIIGIISYSIIYERAEINYIVVTDPNRKNGIGTELLNYALKDIKNNNCEIVSLEVLEDNIPALNLYLKNGFIKSAIRENYYGDKNAILMTRKLR